MTERKSQIVLPINTTSLVTTVVGVLMVSAILLFASVPGNIEALLTDVSEIKKEQASSASMLNNHSQRIQAIENTRFDADAAAKLKEDIVQQFKLTIVPLIDTSNRHERRIDSLA